MTLRELAEELARQLDEGGELTEELHEDLRSLDLEDLVRVILVEEVLRDRRQLALPRRK